MFLTIYGELEDALHTILARRLAFESVTAPHMVAWLREAPTARARGRSPTPAPRSVTTMAEEAKPAAPYMPAYLGSPRVRRPQGFGQEDTL